MSSLPSREQALALVHEHVESESLRRHMYSVEAACRAYARRFGEDEELYGIAGLVHDFDYEKFPEEHPLPGAAILRERGYPEELVHAVLAHYAVRTGVQPETRLDRTLCACDEITGLVTAAALVRPSKSVMDLEAKSVMKKFKDRQFAAGRQPRGGAARGGAAGRGPEGAHPVRDRGDARRRPGAGAGRGVVPAPAGICAWVVGGALPPESENSLRSDSSLSSGSTPPPPEGGSYCNCRMRL